MIDTSYYENAKLNLLIITNINKYINDNIVPITNDNLSCDVLLDRNDEADLILKNLSSNPNTYWFDKYLAFWIYEICYSTSDSKDSYNALINKFVSLNKILDKSLNENANTIDLSPIDTVLRNYLIQREDYTRKKDSVVIVTAIPEEFKAVLRKISLVITVFNRKEIEKIIDPDKVQEKLKIRKKVWVEGIMIRNCEWVKVRLVLAEQYGSVASALSLSNLSTSMEYHFNNEIILVGVAGHLDKLGNAKIGDLVISDSYYNAYLNKDIEIKNIHNKTLNTVSYNDKTLYSLCRNYDITDKFSWKSWIPQKMIVSRPEIHPGSKKYSKETTVYMGPIVCGPSVVKQARKKKLLQDNFKNGLVVEMETYGCYLFVKEQSNLKLKVIKGICDWSNKEKEKSWQPFCADLAAEFTVDYLIAKYGKTIN